VKTTIEIPERTFRQAKSLAGAMGISLRELINAAIEQEIRRRTAKTTSIEPPWMSLFGAFAKTAEDRAETRRIQKRIDAEFEQIEEED
jgi:hypothetical protein